MHKLAELCARRPVFASVLILIMLLLGVMGYLQLGVDRFPKVDLPIITIVTALPGSAPEEVETEITDTIEEAVNTISGIDELHSVSSEGISQIIIIFKLEKDIDVASQEVRDRINAVLSELPQDIRQPLIMKLDPDAVPVLTLALSGAFPITDLTEYADKKLRRSLETIDGVGQVAVIGGQNRQINVYVDPEKLRAYGLTPTQVAYALQTKNAQIPGGIVKEGARELTVRTLGRVESVSELERIAIANLGGHAVRVSDVATVEDGAEEARSLAQLNETPAVLLDIRKQSGANTIEVVRNLRERLDDVLKSLPAGYHVEVVRDQSVYIQNSVNTMNEHLVMGSILAAVVVLIFLANVRTTLISALAIPTSVISTFFVIYFMGYTLNMLTLLALALCVGIVIDDAIVVLENIFRYIEEKGYKPFEAVIAATREIGLAVMAITLSLVAVFFPIAFMEGIVGRFMKGFGVTMAAAIVVSLIVSFTLTPMLAARWLKPSARKNNGNGRKDESSASAEFQAEHARAASKQQGFYRFVEKTYLVMLTFAMRHRWVVVVSSILLLATVPLQMKMIPTNFIPDEDESEFLIQVRAPEGTSLEATQLLVAEVARDVRRLNGIAYTVASSADTEQRIANVGNVLVHLVEPDQRSFSQAEVMDFIRKELVPKYSARDLRVSVMIRDVFSSGISNAGLFVVAGPDAKKLEEYAHRFMARLKSVPGAVDVDSSLIVGKPQYGVVIDREKADDLGVSVTDIAMTVRLLLAGDKVSDYAEKGEMYDVNLRADAHSRNNIGLLQMVNVPSVSRGSVPLSDVVRFEESTGPAQIDRLNRARQVTIFANTEEGASMQALIDALHSEEKALNMGPEYRTTLIGRSKEMARAFSALLTVFILAFAFAYLVMAAQFESWLHPITVLMALPLTLPFALVSLILFDQSLNIFSILGIFVLFAVVKKNAILQIDHTNQLRAAGMPRYEAIIDANLDRLRPILMTTVAFVAGMLPLMISEGAGAATNRTISSVVIGGQTLSLLFTLLATPVAYSLFDDMSALYRRYFTKGRPTAGEAVSENT